MCTSNKVIELPFYYGFDVGANVPADDVYKMLKIIEKHAAELAKLDPTFAQIAKDMKGFQRRGVESSRRSGADPSRPCQVDAREGRLGQQVGFQGRHDVVSGHAGRALAPVRPFSQRAAMTDPAAPRSRLVLDCIYYAVAIFFFFYLFVYFWTSEGGPTLLAMTLVPVTFILFVLNSLREDDLYPRLPSSRQLRSSPRSTSVWRSTSPITCIPSTTTSARRAPARGIPTDKFAGGLMTVLVLEYARKRHMPLFVLNLVLIVYAVYGYVVPGMFYHAGLSWGRVVTAMSVETTTGVFSNLPQIALTVIGSFLLVLAVLSGYGCIGSLLACHQASRGALPARAAAVRGDRLDVRRHRERQRRGQRHHHRLGDHSRHDRRRHAARHRGRDRVRPRRSAAS